MKLTEVSKERTFNLEISESDLRLLFGTMAFRRGAEEGLTDRAFDVLTEVGNYMSNFGVSTPERVEIVRSNFDD